MIVFVPVIEQSETKKKNTCPKIRGISLSLEQIGHLSRLRWFDTLCCYSPTNRNHIEVTL